MNLPVRSGGENPGLSRVPDRGEYPNSLDNAVPPKNFYRNDQWIPHKVRVDHAMEDMDRTIVRGTCHKRVTGMKGNRTEGALVVLEGFVGST